MAGFKRAVPTQGFSQIAFYGGTGTGKSGTTLILGEALAKITGKRVAVINADKDPTFYTQDVPARQFHPKAFDFDIWPAKSITDALDAVYAFDSKTHCCCIADNMSRLWESAINAYEGKKTRADTIPFHAWARIKKPYKEFLAKLLSLQAHVFITGRQVNVFEENDTGEMKQVGYKMKAEGDTAYEFPILIRMEEIRHGQGQGTIQAYIENDTCGALGKGNIIATPTFETLLAPVLEYLNCPTQPIIPTDDDIAAHDADRIEQINRRKEEVSAKILRTFASQIDGANDGDELYQAMKLVTPEVKSQMLTADLNALRQKCRELGMKLPPGTKQTSAALPSGVTKGMPAEPKPLQTRVARDSKQLEVTPAVVGNLMAASHDDHANFGEGTTQGDDTDRALRESEEIEAMAARDEDSQGHAADAVPTSTPPDIGSQLQEAVNYATQRINHDHIYSADVSWEDFIGYCVEIASQLDPPIAEKDVRERIELARKHPTYGGLEALEFTAYMPDMTRRRRRQMLEALLKMGLVKGRFAIV